MKHRKENKKEMRPQNGTATQRVPTKTQHHYTTLYYSAMF